ncbi:alpha/beta fold hydrolase [Mycobacterium branderi]|uniref:Alpha/beta hydrolase n=1 Tax=Mycobacterium branderi TaxID=43348 RepID=A0AA91M0D4_9MYCO|nr:alpha/beta hydrolase [Mycobacterium branderi]MCV7232905.1 alpha/beta hydrolase [Mycobacterium branderi]ORA41027.1 alpha/beta hydrolase [Mycobacterium branderi]
MSYRQPPRSFAPIPVELPPSREVLVRAPDGTRLHTEVFGPEDGYPIVLSHGITCAIRVWAYQIAELAGDYRVIAFDHRGHGRSGIPPRRNYSLHHLASDVDAVLEATLAPGERAVIAGHSMGGIAIAAWSERYRHKVSHRADAVALVNTTTGDLLREVRFLPVPAPFAAVRVLGGRALVSIFGSFTVPPAVRRASREMVSLLAVGADADPDVGALIYELFDATSPAVRGGCGKALVDSLGSRHISLTGLTVPTLVIGSERDRLTPLSQSRRIAAAAPNLVGLVVLPGGHCAMLERPAEVNRELRALAESVSGDRRISS